MRVTSSWAARLATITLGIVLGIGCSDPRSTALRERTRTARQRDTTITTLVSLTFDDTLSDQYQVRALLAAHGMHATFYTISDRVGLDANSMTLGQLVDLASDGNEIAGHTVSHPDLSILGSDDEKREICNGRVRLLNMGFDVRNFAYPFGSPPAQSPLADPVAQILNDCGYNSARGTGDIVSPNTCPGCPYADSIPPGRTYHVRTPDSVKFGTSLETMQGYVTQAEDHGGGWVVIVMHHVCDGCNPYSVPYQQLSDFLDWLEARAANGTVVQTVSEVMGGPLKPPVNGPPRPLPAPGANLLQNASLEVDANNDGLPDCWQKGGSGTNVATFAKTSDASDGVVAEQIDIQSLASGARRLVSKQDTGLCAPLVHAGHAYEVSAAYKATTPARFIAYYLNTARTWIQWTQGPLLSAQSTYTQTTWFTPALPADAVALSVGMSIFAVGQLKLDDFALRDHDTTPPAVAVATPLDGTTVTGTVSLSATASDAGGIDHVVFLVNGAQLTGTSSASGGTYSLDWDTTAFPDGYTAVTARAYDSAGNIASSTSVLVLVSNIPPVDSTAPALALTSPANGSTVSGTTTLSADAGDDHAVQHVSFFIDGQLLANVDSPPYTFDWDTTTATEGSVEVSATAVDTSGNATNASVRVTVDRSAPQVALVSPADGALVSGDLPLIADASDNLGVSSVEFFVNDVSAGVATSSPWTVSFPTAGMADGTSLTIRAVAADRNGNQTASQPVSVAIDNSVPDTTTPQSQVACNDAACQSTYYRSSVQVALSATDFGSSGLGPIVYTLDGTTPDLSHGTRYSAPFMIASDRLLQFRAFDNAGNAEAVNSQLVRVDASPPLTSVTCNGAPCASGWYASPINVAVSAADVGTSGLLGTEYTLDGSDPSSPGATLYAAPFVLSADAALSVASADNAGNVEAPKLFQIRFDTSTPSLTIQCNAGACSSNWYTSSVSVSLTASSAQGGSGISAVRYTLDGSSPAQGTTYTSPIVLNQPTTIRAIAINGAGTPSAEASQSVQVDTVAPTIALTGPLNGANVTGTAPITTNPADNIGVVRVRFYLDGKQLGTRTVSPWKWNWDTTTVTKGNHTLGVRAEDAAGNASTTSTITVNVK